MNRPARVFFARVIHHFCVCRSINPPACHSEREWLGRFSHHGKKIP